jgi:hypothetical protein
MTKKKTPDPVDLPDPTDEEFEPQETPEESELQDTSGEQHVGPGGPDFDPSVQPQSGTPVDTPINPPASIEEEVPLEEPEQ